MDRTTTSPPLARTRSRGFSFRSDKSGGSRGKVDLTESPEDKARRDSIWKNTSKANPNAALNEAQPGVLNLTEQSTLQSLRNSTHKDSNGNVIADPDLSNPTRPRLERPLDTIRSFERAIDNGYRRRSSYLASQPSYEQGGQYGSRRNSYFGYENNGPSAGRHSAMSGGYYGGPQQRQRYGNRVMSESAIPNHHRPYGQHTYQQSQDTMNTNGAGSDSTGPWANSTDPTSSENSSIDRNVYGSSNGYGQNGRNYSPPIMEEGPYGGPVQAPQQHQQVQQPQQQPPAPRKPIALGNSTGEPMIPLPSGKLPPAARAAPEKKKGWLKRTFSKKE